MHDLKIFDVEKLGTMVVVSEYMVAIVMIPEISVKMLAKFLERRIVLVYLRRKPIQTFKKELIKLKTIY